MKQIVLITLCLFLCAACSGGEDQETREVEIRGQVTGTLDYHRGLEGEGILPRDAIVWTPPGYDSDTNTRYPVLYMHDGQNVFDPATSYTGIDWGVDEAVDRLISEGAIEPMIVVALTNTPDRNADYSPGDKGEAYMEFLVNTVKPLIDKTYRTKPGKKHTLTGGASMGGLISCMLGWQYPEVFGAVMCFSPAFKVEGQKDWSLFFSESGGDRRDVFFLVINGGIGLEEVLQPGIDEMLYFWESRGYREGKDFVFVKHREAEHNEEAWAKQFPDALLRSLESARQ